MKQEIYILTHKTIDYDLDLSKYKPIYCGAALSDNKDIDIIRDDKGEDNISAKNDYYLETTGIYWIWKHSDADIKGQMQIRRFLSVNPEFISNILNKYDIITANPINFGPRMPIQFQYEVFHNVNDIKGIRQVLAESFPEYVKSYDKYIAESSILYYSNCFIASKKIYDDLCNFAFSVLKIFENKYKYYDYNIRLEHAKETVKLYSEFKTKSYQHTDVGQIQYQMRICGALFERLVTLYIFHNQLKVYNCGEYITMENNMKI